MDRDSIQAVIAEMISAIPASWLDPLLTGNKAVVSGPLFDCSDIESLLRGIKERLQGIANSISQGSASASELATTLPDHSQASKSKSDIERVVQWLEGRCDYGPPCSKCTYCVIAKTIPWFDSSDPKSFSTPRDTEVVAREVCAQCETNARHNEAGGYLELAAECRAYCRRGHVTASPDQVVAVADPFDVTSEDLEDINLERAGLKLPPIRLPDQETG